MKVKLLTRWLAVPGKKPGDVVDLPDAQAKDGIARGICRKARKDPEDDLQAMNGQLKTRIAELEKELAEQAQTAGKQHESLAAECSNAMQQATEVRHDNEELKKLIADLETQIQQLTARNEALEAQAAGQAAEETKPATEKAGGKGKDAKSSSGKGKTK